MASTSPKLQHVGFNQDQSCFAVGLSSGFKVYNCSPFKDQIDRELEGGGIRHVEMLFKCNIFALVGAPNNGRFPPNQVIIWDDHKRKDIGELSFRHEVKAVRLRRDKVVVVLEYKVLVYNFADLTCILEIDTVSNGKGLCALCPSSNQTVLACPGSHRGYVRMELFELRKTFTIQAHTSPISCLALSADGSRLVTASEKGTILRVFESLTGKQVQELRRGAQAAEISSLAFNPTSSMLCCSSVRGTVHVFKLSDSETANSDANPDGSEVAPAQAINARSSLSFMGSMVNYFNSEWSFAKYCHDAADLPEDSDGRMLNEILEYRFRLPGADAYNSHSICSFAAESNTILVVTITGNVYTCVYKPEGPAGQECEAALSFSILPEPVPAEQDEEADGTVDDEAA